MLSSIDVGHSKTGPTQITLKLRIFMSNVPSQMSKNKHSWRSAYPEQQLYCIYIYIYIYIRDKSIWFYVVRHRIYESVWLIDMAAGIIIIYARPLYLQSIKQNSKISIKNWFNKRTRICDRLAFYTCAAQQAHNIFDIFYLYSINTTEPFCEP